MAITDEFPTFSQIGVTIREDLLDFVTNISPMDTPLLSMLPRVPATSTKHEWIEDSLATVSTAGAIEGDPFNAVALNTPTRHVNWTQIFRKDFSITGSNEAALHAGIPTQIGYQGRKALEEIANNTEAALIQSTLAATPQGTVAAARTLRGLSDWAGNEVGTAGTAPSEANFNNLLELLWNDGVFADTVLCTATMKKGISAYLTATNHRAHHDGGVNDPRMIISNVMTYEGDFGTVNVHLERYCDALDAGYAFSMRYLRNAVYRPTRLERLGKRGDSEDIMATQELTLEVLAPNAVGKWVIA